MLNKLSPEQEQKMLEVKQYWLDYFFSCKNSINKEAANIGIDWLYELSKLQKPIKIYVDSPLGCQYAVQILKSLPKKWFGTAQVRAQVRAQVWDQVWDQVGDQVGAQVRDQVRAQVRDQVRAQVRDQVWAQVWDQVRAQVRAQVWDQVGDQVGAQVRDQVWDQVGAQVRDQVGDQVGAQVWAQVRAQVRAQVWDQVWAQVRDQVGDQVGAQVWAQVRAQQYEQFSQYGNIWDYGWISFFDFFTQIGIANNNNFSNYKNLLQSGIYDMIQLNGVCIVSDLPCLIKRNNRQRLHSENGPAIKFKDGYELFFWNGASVPKEWIENPQSITKEIIIKESNAEKRRCLREILGAKKYYEVAFGKDALKIIDEDTDDHGNPMRLYETVKADDILKKKIQFLSVICPSTKREYNIYPPSQNTKNVWAAKADTFSNEKIKYRHGDVGLVNLNKQFERPVAES